LVLATDILHTSWRLTTIIKSPLKSVSRLKECTLTSPNFYSGSVWIRFSEELICCSRIYSV